MRYIKEDFSQVSHYFKDSSIFENLILNGNTLNDIYEYLDSSSIYSVYSDNAFLGFFSVEGNEIHAYILEEFRNKSSIILKGMMDYAFNELDLNFIVTYVRSDVYYIVRFLKILGFSLIFKEYNVVNKEDGDYDLYHLLLTKEEYNGKFI